MVFVSPRRRYDLSPKVYPGPGGTIKKGLGMYYDAPKQVLRVARVYDRIKRYTPYYYQDRLRWELERRVQSDIIKYKDAQDIMNVLFPKKTKKQTALDAAGSKLGEKRQGSRSSYKWRYANYFDLSASGRYADNCRIKFGKYGLYYQGFLA